MKVLILILHYVIGAQLTFTQYEKSNPLEIMTHRAENLRRYCGDQKIGFRMNKNAKVTVKGKVYDLVNF